MLLGIGHLIGIKARGFQPLIGVARKGQRGGAGGVCCGLGFERLKPIAVQASQIVAEAHQVFKVA